MLGMKTPNVKAWLHPYCLLSLYLNNVASCLHFSVKQDLSFCVQLHSQTLVFIFVDIVASHHCSIVQLHVNTSILKCCVTVSPETVVLFKSCV